MNHLEFIKKVRNIDWEQFQESKDHILRLIIVGTRLTTEEAEGLNSALHCLDLLGDYAADVLGCPVYKDEEQ